MILKPKVIKPYERPSYRTPKVYDSVPTGFEFLCNVITKQGHITGFINYCKKHDIRYYKAKVGPNYQYLINRRIAVKYAIKFKELLLESNHANKLPLYIKYLEDYILDPNCRKIRNYYQRYYKSKLKYFGA